MSTSVLYHGFGVRGYRYLKTEYEKGELIFHIEKKEEDTFCAECGSREVIKQGRVVRWIRTLPIGKRKVWLAVHLHRLECKECGALRLEPLLIAFPKKHWTKSLGHYIVNLLKHATVKDVAEHLGMSWDTVKEIHAWALRKRFKKRKIQHLRHLGVDEIAIRRGHYYLTIVVDLESGAIVWVREGREEASLEPFLKRLKKAKAKLKAIAMDMWKPYISVTSRYYGAEIIVFDRYHVIANYNRMLDELRRQEAAAAPENEKEIYKGTRYLLLKNREKIQNGSTAKAKLDRLLTLNRHLNIAYILKEELRIFWSQPNFQEAEVFLNNWIEKAENSGIRLVEKFAKTLRTHRSGLLNYFNHFITTGKVEGLNNKIKTLKRQAYGFRDTEYFKLRLYFLHESTYALIG